MPHPDHDDLLAAFGRVEPGIQLCHRGHPQSGYTHIHGPRQAPGGDRCTSHTVTVEKQNGTVSLRSPFGQALGGTARAPVPIGQDPMGYSHRADYGNYGDGFEASIIRARWGTFDAFARDVIAGARTHLGNW